MYKGNNILNIELISDMFYNVHNMTFIVKIFRKHIKYFEQTLRL